MVCPCRDRSNERMTIEGNHSYFAHNEGVLRSLAWYDELRATNPVTRVGNVDVFSSGAARDSTIFSEEFAICHLAGIFNFRVGDNEDIFWQAIEQAAIIGLAAKHLNFGDGSIVPQVDGLNDRCNVRFTVEYHDTEYLPHKAINEAIRLTDRPADGPKPLPCSFLGAKRSYVSIPTAVITGLREYPQISPWSTMPALDDKSKYPLFGRSVPSDYGTAVAVILAMREHLDVRHLAILHVDDDYATSFASGLQRAALEYAPDMIIAPVDMPFSPSDDDIHRTVQNLKNTEFRYIFCILYVGPSRVDALLTEAYHQGIAGTGEFTWLFSDAVGMSLTWNSHEVGSPMHHALHGTGLIQATGGLASSPQLTAFHGQLKTLRSEEDLRYILSKSPFRNITDNGENPLEDVLDRRFFSPGTKPEPYSPFLYDAVIATGLAACDAASSSSRGDYFDGPSHFDAFRRMDFDGASGRVLINPETGTRVATSAYFTLTNFVQGRITKNDATNRSLVKFKAVQSASFENGTWVELWPFVFSDGSNTPLLDLPPVKVDENLLERGWRAAGLVMCAIALTLAIGFAGWTRWNRQSRVVKASQPVFLYLICIGVFVFASSIIPLSYDEGIANAEGCSIACTTFPWLVSIGFAVTFSALFTKTYRVNVIVKSASKYRRIVVAPWDVAKPMLLMLGGNLLVLSLMTVFSPLEWEVKVVANDSFDRPIETRGFCNWEGTIPYVATLGALNFGCLAFSVYQAFQARNVSTEYAESEYILKAMITILLACFLGFPVLILTQDITAAFYFVLASILFVISCSVLLLIFAPKVSAFQKSKDHHSTRSLPLGDLSDLSAENRIHFTENNGLRILIPQRERELSEKVRSLRGDLHDAEIRIEELTALNRELSAAARNLPDTGGHSSMQLGMPFLQDKIICLGVPSEEEIVFCTDTDAGNSEAIFSNVMEVGDDSEAVFEADKRDGCVESESDPLPKVRAAVGEAAEESDDRIRSDVRVTLTAIAAPATHTHVPRKEENYDESKNEKSGFCPSPKEEALEEEEEEEEYDHTRSETLGVATTLRSSGIGVSEIR